MHGLLDAHSVWSILRVWHNLPPLRPTRKGASVRSSLMPLGGAGILAAPSMQEGGAGRPTARWMCGAPGPLVMILVASVRPTDGPLDVLCSGFRRYIMISLAWDRPTDGPLDVRCAGALR